MVARRALRARFVVRQAQAPGCRHPNFPFDPRAVLSGWGLQLARGGRMRDIFFSQGLGVCQVGVGDTIVPGQPIFVPKDPEEA